MWRTVLTFIIAGIAITLGLSIAYYKHAALSFPLVPDTSINSWYVELHTTMQSPERWKRKAGKQQEAAVNVIAPTTTARYAVVDSEAIARSFGKQLSKEHGQKIIHFTKRNPDDTESVYLRFVLYELDVNDVRANDGKEEATAALSNPYLKKNRLPTPDVNLSALYDTIDTFVNEATAKSSSPHSFVAELWSLLAKDEGTRKYLRTAMGAQDNAALITSLTQVAGYTVRMANGLKLGEASERSSRIRRWVEVLYKDTWMMFDVDAGEYFDADARLYRWWTGTDPLVNVAYFKNFVTRISLKPNVDSSLTRALWNAKEKQPLAFQFAAQNLPLDQQSTLQVLLLMPLGALIVAFMRQVIGVKTLGTFMPVLVALAFRETGAQFGIVFFMTIIFIGLMVRSYLDRLRLLLVPRLAAVLCVVVAMMIVAMIGFKDSTIPLGVSIALFPVVIMTMFIERMSTMWDESGAKSAVVACTGSMMIALFIYLIATHPYVKHAMITFPELLLVVFGLCLLLGRYNGYKLTEYRRFRQLKRAIREQQEEATKAKG
jgi:hypothetical protein